MAPRYWPNRRQPGASSTASSRRSRYRSSTASTSAPLPIGIQRTVPPVSRVRSIGQAVFQRQPARSARSTTVTSSQNDDSSRLDDDRREATLPDDDSIDEIVMAVDMRDKGTVGCAYYVAAEEKLHFMQDIQFGGSDIIEAREFHITKT